MAPKRSARPPPPPPPVASSEETASGSGSDEEEEIAHSPPAAALERIAPPPPPPQDQESESSDEGEDGEEEEEDGEEEEEEEEEGDEEEEDDKANHVIPSSATNNPPPPSPTRKESETSGEEEEEEEEEEADDEVPEATNPAPDQEIVANGVKPPSAPFQRTWSTDDEVRILEALAAHRQEHGTLPRTEELADAVAGKLDNSGCSLSELKSKVRSLQSKHTKAVSRGAPPSKGEDSRLFDLCENVWPSDTSAAANGGAGRDPEEMWELYPYLAEEVKAIQEEHPGLFKRAFEMIDDSKARAMDERIKKHRGAQMNLHLRRHDLMKAVTKTLMDLE